MLRKGTPNRCDGVRRGAMKKKELDLMEFLTGDELDFYEMFVMKLSEEEERLFWAEHPDFLKEYGVESPVSERKIRLLKEKRYREILKKRREKELQKDGCAG